MQVIRPGTSAVGRDAAVRKYDALSALMAFALAGDPNRQRLVLRLMALITTRYNWQRNELAMGQREIARLWCVDERTVKRDMARLRAHIETLADETRLSPEPRLAEELGVSRGRLRQ